VKLLILGGTVFLGRAAAGTALERGHELTLFNRGRSKPEVHADVETLHGDRDGGLDALRGRAWDAVIDTCGYVPRVVRDSAELLAEAVEHYTFVSSISVYSTLDRPGFDESSPVIELEDPVTEDVPANYGGLKAACERVVEEVLPGRAAIVRAGLIVGPHDPTGRFTYWPERIARGGDVLVPGRPERPVQFVDVRDLGAFLVTVAEQRTAGVFNASGPPMPFGELVESAARVSGSGASPVWVGEEYLLGNEVGEWMELPLWIAETNDEFRHMQEADVSRAAAAGLTIRPVDDTVRGTLDWVRSESPERPAGVGLSAEREGELLAGWTARTARE
jgi:2'-hydroxyisoflavone reductase